MQQADDEAPVVKLELKVVGEIQRLKLDPEDVLLVRVPLGTLTDDILEQIHGSIANLFGEHQKILVLEGEIDMDVIAPDDKTNIARLSKE